MERVRGLVHKCPLDVGSQLSGAGSHPEKAYIVARLLPMRYHKIESDWNEALLGGRAGGAVGKWDGLEHFSRGERLVGMCSVLSSPS